MRKHNTSIKKIIQAKNEYEKSNQKEVIFLSDWDADLNSLPIPIIFDQSMIEQKMNSLIGSYYYWTDEHNYKKYFIESFKYLFGEDINKDEFLIGSNGTTSIFLSLMALKEMSINNMLILTPMYFSTLNILEQFGFNIFTYELQIENDFECDIGTLDDLINKNCIEALFITDPLFSTGMEISLEKYIEIFEVCSIKNIIIIIDYIYGGMQWDETNFIFNKKIQTIITKYSNYIIIESITKRLFINGVKTSLIFSNSNIIKMISRLSIYTVGSMCYLQLNTFKKIYNKNNFNSINSLIEQNISQCRRNFSKIISMLLGKNCIVSNCQCSYFFLLGIPYSVNLSDIDLSIYILNEIGVVTVPHSRYLLFNNKYYIFRVNLLLDEIKLFEGISRIISSL